MVKVKGNVMIFTGKDYKLVDNYAKEHKLTFKEAVYLALANGIASECCLLKEKKK